VLVQIGPKPILHEAVLDKGKSATYFTDSIGAKWTNHRLWSPFSRILNKADPSVNRVLLCKIPHIFYNRPVSKELFALTRPSLQDPWMPAKYRNNHLVLLMFYLLTCPSLQDVGRADSRRVFFAGHDYGRNIFHADGDSCANSPG